jgi:hypothetical protein
MGGEKRKQPFIKENNLNILIDPKTPKRFWMSCPPMSINSRSWSSLNLLLTPTRISFIGVPSKSHWHYRGNQLLCIHTCDPCMAIHVLMWLIAKQYVVLWDPGSCTHQCIIIHWKPLMDDWFSCGWMTTELPKVKPFKVPSYFHLTLLRSNVYVIE